MKRRFEKLFGNGKTANRLSDAILSRALPHAILITGPKGSGKKTLCYEIAAAQNCLMQSDENAPVPCGRCVNCKRIYENNFPDFKFLVRSDSKATIGVEEIRIFREDMFLSSTEADSKIYVIEDADTMTVAAQNALLKVLEEPPPSVHIILLSTSADKILSTIKSRTQYVQMQIFSADEIENYIKEQGDFAEALLGSSEERLRGIILSAGGVIGEATSRLSQRSADEADERRLVGEVLAMLPKRASFSGLYSAMSQLPQKRELFRLHIERCICALRDMITAKTSSSAQPLYFLSRKDAEAAMGSMTLKRMVNIYDVLVKSLEDIDKNVLIPTLITDICVKIKEV